MNEKLKTFRKDSTMKITIGPISLDIFLFFRLWLPPSVFIGLCAGIFVAFGAVLRMLDQIDLRFIGVAWLLLLIFYIIFGVAFTRFVARLLRRSFGLEELRVQRRMVVLSGFPFYALCLFFLMSSIVCILSPDVDVVALYASVAGFLGFGLVSCSYLLLLRFFLGRSTAIAHQ
jgi:hypothetical protein